jgi:hypothetical protein
MDTQYANSAELARATPHVRLSRPTPPDNTEWFNHDEQRVVEPAKVVLCFDCQQPIEAGKGVQARRYLSKQYGEGASGVNISGAPCDAIVHPECNAHFEFMCDLHR